MKQLYTILGILLAIPSGAFADASPSEAIQQNIQGWETALNNGNTTALQNIYTEDAVVMPPSSEILSGRDAIKSYWDGLLGVGVSEYNVDTVNIRFDGNVAYQTVLWEAIRTDIEGNTFQFDGNMSNVLERQQDGSWKINLQSWN